jgi:hypothetical protein
MIMVSTLASHSGITRMINPLHRTDNDPGDYGFDMTGAFSRNGKGKKS